MADVKTPEAGNPFAIVQKFFEGIGQVRELAMGVGILGIVLMLLLPLPTWLLDFGLAISVTLSVLILMTALFIEKPLQFSSFPTILLVVTMLRLGLNLASTRLILAHGHEGPHAAGSIIQAFGAFLMGGDVVIGITIFIILMIVNFVVITKGSGRIAEVAARFSLDAMPGKQMAIDADMSAGLIDEKQARERRAELEGESGFYGAMDGASKFVKGDAIAGLIITAVNIIVGLIIGIAIHAVPAGEAFETYTLLTVGDGLVAMISGLIVSTAAGLIVTKGGVSGKTDAILFNQLTHYPRGLGIAGGMLGFLALMPGMPFFIFAPLALGCGASAWFLSKSHKEKAAKILQEAQAQQDAATQQPSEEPISSTLAVDQIRVELGYGLLNMVNDASGYRLTDQIKALRRQLATDLGFVLPTVRILDNMALNANTYVVFLKEVEIARGDLRPNMLLVMHPGGDAVALPGESTREPAFGLPATWVERSLRDEANFRGYTVVDAPTVITTHLTEIIKENLPDLLSYTETQKLLDELPKETQKLVADLVPNRLSVSGVQRVLQNLLAEQISIRDLPSILEGIAEAVGYTQNLVLISEHVRGRLARQISTANARNGVITLITLSAQWESRFIESLHGTGDDRQLAMAPSLLQEFIGNVRDSFERHAAQGDIPCLLTSPGIRPYVRSIIERFRPATVVLSQNEIHPKAKIRALGVI